MRQFFGLRMSHGAQDEVLTALVDLVVFELKPDLGDEPADLPATGGAK